MQRPSLYDALLGTVRACACHIHVLDPYSGAVAHVQEFTHDLLVE